MTASELKDRLRADLKAAMQAKASDEVRLLRTLIAALDNAEAVPVEARPAGAPPALSRRFGDPSGELARRDIGDGALAELLTVEAQSRLAAAEDYDRHGESGEAARLRREAELINRYRA
jgi:uncharacterized protein YqeY